jgi:hypothetical protein
MKVMVYSVREDGIEANKERVRAVVVALRKRNATIQYASAHVGSGTFLHVMDLRGEASALENLPEFEIFRRGLEAIIIGKPTSYTVDLVAAVGFGSSGGADEEGSPDSPPSWAAALLEAVPKPSATDPNATAYADARQASTDVSVIVPPPEDRGDGAGRRTWRVARRSGSATASDPVKLVVHQLSDL